MKIPRPLYLRALEHCESIARARGEEACGVLAGPQGEPDRVSELYGMANVHEFARSRYEFDPEAQVKLWCALEERGMWPHVIYHSHLSTPALMSSNDVRYANDETIKHLIFSLVDEEARLWRVVGGRTRALSFQLTDAERRPSGDEPTESLAELREHLPPQLRLDTLRVVD